jgi:N-acetylglucosamine malate deacetylase 1
MTLNRIAAIVAHPDDEVLACGATLARHAQEGAEVQALILASGLTSRGHAEVAALEHLKSESRSAAAKLGISKIEFADLPDNQMDTVPLLSIVQRVEAFLKVFRAERIYTHHGGDLNIDHRLTYQAVLTACRPLPGTTAREILAGEVNSATEWAPPVGFSPFVPTEFTDVSGTLDQKLAAMACYAGEVRPWPHPRSLRSIEALALWRGTQCGFSAAEAFVTLRRLS